MSRSVLVDPSHHEPSGDAPPTHSSHSSQDPQDPQAPLAAAAPVRDAALTEESLAPDPVIQFSRWFSDASRAGLPQPNAMVLATASLAGLPRARTVLLKAYGEHGFTFYTNKTSRKGRDLGENPRACLLFPWHAMRRQVILEGAVTELSAAESEPYFHSRPHGSQVGAWASRQSSVLRSRAELDGRFEELSRRWPEGTEVPMPQFWGGYVVKPDLAEFWQGRQNRLHDRFIYRRSGDRWVIERLAP